MIETYLLPEVENIVTDPDKLKEWTDMVEKLGLDKQQELVGEKKGASPIPFQPMNEQEKRVYTVLCPAKVDYKKYNKSTIPLEVLSLIALSKEEEYFPVIQIWYNEKEPDPLAVGRIGKEWDGKYFLIARWGDELCSFAELKQRAMKKYRESAEIKLKKAAADAQTKLQNLDVNVASYFDCSIQDYEVTPF